jgi:hypothetical protein
MKARAACSLGLQLAVCALALGGGCRPPPAPQPAAPEPKPSSEHRVSVSADAEVEVTFDEAATGTVVQGTVVADIEDAAVHTTAGDPQSDASSPATQRSAPGDCKATRASIEAALRRAARCSAHEECAMEYVHAAFGCRNALRRDAPLDALRDGAARYVARCNPHFGVPRCRYYTGALCTRHRCTLASPEELEAAGEPAHRAF